MSHRRGALEQRCCRFEIGLNILLLLLMAVGTSGCVFCEAVVSFLILSLEKKDVNI